MNSIVDAHHHYWHSATAAGHDWIHSDHRESLHQDFLAEHLEPSLQATGVSATVLVQSANTFAENDRMSRIAETTPSVAGVVGYLPMADIRKAEETLEGLGGKQWCGVRHLIGGGPLGWLLERDSIRVCGLLAQRNLAWDVVIVSQEQAEAVAALAQAVPDLRIIVDHLARPPVGGEDDVRWKDRIALLADNPNIAMKVSVGINALAAWGVWNPTELTDSIEEVVQKFTPQRLMQASNWPVSLLAAPYEAVWHDMTRLLDAHLSSNELARIQGGTATEWYQLDIPTKDAPI